MGDIMPSCDSSKVGKTYNVESSTGQTKQIPMPSGSMTNYYCKKETKVCKQTGTSTSYYFDTIPSSQTGQTSCTKNNFTCDANHVNQTHVTCTSETSVCNSGTKLNETYCYVVN